MNNTENRNVERKGVKNKNIENKNVEKSVKSVHYLKQGSWGDGGGEDDG